MRRFLMLRITLAIAMLMAGIVGAAAACPRGQKELAGTCVAACPGGYDDQGATCVYRRGGGTGGGN
jgi:hypothetical protein